MSQMKAGIKGAVTSKKKNESSSLTNKHEVKKEEPDEALDRVLSIFP